MNDSNSWTASLAKSVFVRPNTFMVASSGTRMPGGRGVRRFAATGQIRG